MSTVCVEAFQQVVEAIRPGRAAAQVYRAWQDRVDEAGLAHYRRHHCGYLVGIGFPPSWVGGSMVVGLRHDSDLKLQTGMTFHLLSWLMGTGQGDYFVSNAAMLTENGCDVRIAEDTGRFPPYVDLYLDMLNKQLTYDALKVIGFNLELMQAMGGEMVFMQGLAHESKIAQGIFVATKR